MIISIFHPHLIEDGPALFFYFTLYSLIGWFLENSYSFLIKEGFFKSNFFKGPFKPMYGFAPVLMLLFINKNTSWPVVVLLCLFIPTVVEYVSGVMLHKVFRQKYWDYSNMKVHLHGHICLPFSVCWLLLSLLFLKYIHPLTLSFYKIVETYWIWLTPFVLLYFLLELLTAIKKHSIAAIPEKRPTNPF